MERTRQTMNENFTIKPGDVFLILNQGGLSSTVTARVTNGKTGERFNLTFKNVPETWLFFKEIDSVPARSVMVEQDGEVVPYTDSYPYQARFSN